MSDRLNVPAVVLDREGIIRLSNHSMEELMGWSRLDLEAQRWSDACTPADHRAEVDRWIGKALRGALRAHTIVAIRRDGSLLNLCLEFTLFGRDDEQGVLATATQVSAFSRTQLRSTVGEIDYELEFDQSHALSRLVVDGERVPLDALNERRCFRLVYDRDQPCPDCPLSNAGPWPKLVTRRRSATSNGEGHYEITTVEQTPAGPRFRIRVVSDRTLEAIQNTRVDQLVKNAKLSPREREILSYLLLGRSLEDIAMLSGLAVRTVKYHQAHILEKLGADSRVDLTRLLL